MPTKNPNAMTTSSFDDVMSLVAGAKPSAVVAPLDVEDASTIKEEHSFAAEKNKSRIKSIQSAPKDKFADLEEVIMAKSESISIAIPIRKDTHDFLKLVISNAMQNRVAMVNFVSNIIMLHFSDYEEYYNHLLSVAPKAKSITEWKKK